MSAPSAWRQFEAGAGKIRTLRKAVLPVARKGLVTRRRDAEDRRSVRVHLTEAATCLSG